MHKSLRNPKEGASSVETSVPAALWIIADPELYILSDALPYPLVNERLQWTSCGGTPDCNVHHHAVFVAALDSRDLGFEKVEVGGEWRPADWKHS